MRIRRSKQKYLSGTEDQAAVPAIEVGVLDQKTGGEIPYRLVPVQIGDAAGGDLEFRDSYDSADDAEEYETDREDDDTEEE